MWNQGPVLDGVIHRRPAITASACPWPGAPAPGRNNGGLQGALRGPHGPVSQLSSRGQCVSTQTSVTLQSLRVRP